MLKVYIIEDDNNQRVRLTKYIGEKIKQNNLQLEITLSTDKIKELISKLEGNGARGIYFIDIDLGQDINGLELAEFIRKYDPNGYIIFVTSYSELNRLTFKYKVDAMDFIVKDDFQEMAMRVEECLIKANELEKRISGISKEMYIVNMGEKSIEYEKKNILFFKSNSSSPKIILHGINRQIEFDGNIKDIEKEVGDNFFMVNRTSLINLNKAETISENGNYILMKNGESCKIRIRKKSKLLKLIKLNSINQ
ncbi:LytR/AlgR family response regulator transcription factor [Clostridium vincentii]|uniref:Stage 0 sporulation protein A homolog n=1 Tax=Clostridium vincentii TaxID=52704 RepID=A0A2T0BDE0_9CLOT|nr:response regulator [Clostridium vincentii]PRR81920.1 Accessory protein regulator protein A [Clostridium vincentii]